MSFINDFKDCMTDSMTWRPFTGRDEFGKPSFGSGSTFKGRLTRKNRLVRDNQGEETVSGAQFTVLGSPAVGPQDQVELSDGTTPPIASVERFQDDRGYSHTVVMFR